MPDAPATTAKSPKAPTAPKPRKVAAVRASASKALDATGSTARDLAAKAAAGIEANPLATLVGGIALGAIAGAFVPRSEQEERLLAPIGQKLSDTAYDAIDAAKETAKSEFDILGLTRDAARGQVSKVIEGVVTAVSSAGAAALTAANEKASAKKVVAAE
jgi:gas vesicle protein